MSKTNIMTQNKRIIDALRTVIDIPEGVTSLDLSLRIDDVPRVNLSYNAMEPRLGLRRKIRVTINDTDYEFQNDSE